MPESSTNDPADDEAWANFDMRKFVLSTIDSVQFTDAIAGVIEDRVLRMEEIIAAPWWRRWPLWRRLRREIRASAATWPDEYIPRKDFLGRRWEWASSTASKRHDRQSWQPTAVDNRGEPDGPPPPGMDRQDGDADPGAGFLA